MASLKDIAERIGVSVATVSYVLNGTKTLSPEVTRRVLDAARELNYRPNRTARALRTGRSEAIGLILPDIANPYFPTLAQVIQREALRRGYALFLIDCADDEEAERAGFERLAERNVEGIIWAPVNEDAALEPTMPVVTVDRTLPRFDCVSADHRAGGALLGRHIAALGHRSVGLLSGPQPVDSVRERRAGLIEALPDDVEIRWEHMVPSSFMLPDPVAEVLKDPGVDVVVGVNDAVAITALHALGESNIRVPEEVSVLGFDDMPLAAMTSPPLTTIRQPLEAIGVAAVEMLQARIQGSNEPAWHRRLPVTLVERRSAARRSDLSAVR